MNYWWCNQGSYWDDERSAGVVCSSAETSNPTYRKTVGQVKQGDLIIHYRKPSVVAISRALEDAEHHDQLPLVNGADYGEGWRFKTEYFDLTSPVNRNEYCLDLVPLIEKHYPIDRRGWARQGYFYPFNEAGWHTVTNCIQGPLPIWSNTTNADDNELDKLLSVTDESEEFAIECSPELAETDKKQLIKARRGQGIFRSELMKIESECRLTGTTNSSFLNASHIKPWRVSDNQERLDGNNGLLLAPHVDRLFDQGWISFTDNGELLTANIDIDEQLHQWGVQTPAEIGQLNNQQQQYLAYHRKFIFNPKTGFIKPSTRKATQPRKRR